jgi:2-keto-3-deoxy-L-rhamnonate aldolase RhmA
MSTVRDRAGWVGLREKLRSSTECVLGTWVKIPALETVEMLAAAGFDFIVLDEEHSPLTLESSYRATALGQALGMHVLVRTPDRSGGHVQRLLDSGVDGLLVPQVSSVEEARRVVGDMVFAPEGRRGLGSTSRAGLWGTLGNEEYVRRGSEEIVRGIQLEDAGVLDHLDEIMTIPRLDAVFLGTGDLGLSTGLPPDDPVFQGHIDRFLAAAKTHGLPCGTAVGSGRAARAAAERGFTFVMISNDATMFAEGAKAALAGAVPER